MAGDASVSQLHFIPGQGRILSVHSDFTIHLWEMATKNGHFSFKVIRSFKMPNSQVNLVTTCCLSFDLQHFFIGTEGSTVHVLDLQRFYLTGRSLPVDLVMQNAPDDFRKASPGAVEALLESPTEPDRILVGFNRGLIVLWNASDGQIERSWNARQQQELENACWLRSGQQFVTSHSDGSYVSWRVDSDKPTNKAFVPYGPYPCKPITKVEVKSYPDEQMIVFAGGMPRSSFGDRHTVSALMGNRQAAFDFGSKVLDFLVLCHAEPTDLSKNPPTSPVSPVKSEVDEENARKSPESSVSVPDEAIPSSGTASPVEEGSTPGK